MVRLSWIENYGDDASGSFNLTSLNRDGAILNIFSALKNTSYLYSVYEECYKCPYIPELTISNNHTHYIDTTYKKFWRVASAKSLISPRSSNDSIICDFHSDFGEFGVYGLEISNNGCGVKTLKEPVNIYFPILPAVLICFVVFIAFRIFFTVWNVYVKKIAPATEVNYEDGIDLQKPKRLKSLDTFRGICIILMIFVNYGSGGYVILDHAVWNGLHLADVIFPAFMWIMGVCIPMTISSAVAKGSSRKCIIGNIIRRSCILLLLGVLQNGIVSRQVQLFGVLEKFAVSYLVTATITAVCYDSLKKPSVVKGWLTRFTDILAVKWQWTIAIILMVIHTLVIKLMEVPNCPRGYLGPGGYHDNAQHVGCAGGAAGYIDDLILGKRSFSWPSTRKIYNSDPLQMQNILGHLPSMTSVIAGIQAGVTIMHYKEHHERIKRWLLWGIILLLIGTGLCGFLVEEGFIPINKTLWSTSYVCVNAGIAFLVFTLCYYIVDVKNWWSGKPLTFAGMNSIVLYVGHAVMASCVPFRWILDGKLVHGTHFLTILENVWATTMWLLVAYYLYRRKYFLSI